MKATIFHNNKHTNITKSYLDITPKQAHSYYHHLTIPLFQKNNIGTDTKLYYIHSSKQTLPCHMHTKLVQLGANKLSLLQKLPMHSKP